MARPLRIEYPGAIYHVTSRMPGDTKSRLFKSNADRERFTERLRERVEQYNIRLYMFVLMRNHFHLVFETPEGNCSKFMQSLSTAYTVYYNLCHNRHGHLFDGRYKAKLVEGDDYFLALSRYVHLNPVRVSMYKNKPLEEKRDLLLRKYRWSSYQSYIGKCKKLTWADHSPVLAEMSGKKKEWPKKYKEYVESGLAETDKDFEKVLKESPVSIGSEEFKTWVCELYNELAEKSESPEDVSFRRIIEPMKAEDVLSVVAEVFEVKTEEFLVRRRNSPLRAVAAKYLIKYAGLTQRQVARYLEVGTGGAINKQLERLPNFLVKDKRLSRILVKMEKNLNAQRKRQ